METDNSTTYGLYVLINNVNPLGTTLFHRRVTYTYNGYDYTQNVDIADALVALPNGSATACHV